MTILICDLCGVTFDHGAFCIGKLWCSECFAGQAPAPAMLPSPREAAQIREWLRPTTTVEVRP